MPVNEPLPASVRAQDPRTEELVAAIWSEAFGLGDIDRNADFFELGGHSALAANIAAKIRSIFDVEVSLSFFFEHPTISDAARAIDSLVRNTRAQ